MKKTTLMVIGLTALCVSACDFWPRELPQPLGTGAHGDVPEGIAEALPDDVFEIAQEHRDWCNSGELSSCLTLAEWFAQGYAQPVHHMGPPEHADEGEHAVEDEHAEADDEHADDEHADEGAHGAASASVPQNVELSEALFRLTCDAGWDGACGRLGELALEGVFSLPQGESIELLEESCERGNTFYCHRLGQLYADGTLPGGNDAAAPYLAAACAGSIQDACFEWEHTQAPAHAVLVPTPTPQGAGGDHAGHDHAGHDHAGHNHAGPGTTIPDPATHPSIVRPVGTPGGHK